MNDNKLTPKVMNISKLMLATALCLFGLTPLAAQDTTKSKIKAQGVTTEMLDVLRHSVETCQAVQGGHYEMEYLWKPMSRLDTISTTYVCDFRKMPEDTIFGKAFSLMYNEKGVEFTSYILYTGQEFVTYFNDEKVANVQPCDCWADDIIAIRHNYNFYEPLTEPSCPYVNVAEWLMDSNYTFVMRDTLLGDRPCYQVTYRTTESKDLGFNNTLTRFEVTMCIDKQDYMPLEYVEYLDIVEGLDTMTQFNRTKLISFTPEYDPQQLTLSSIPSKYKLKEAKNESYQEPKTLPIGRRAPKWNLPSLDGSTVSLSDLKGKVVLIDFFYKSCAPCCAAMPFLQRLHEQYSDQGLVVVGIDPYDDPVKDKMADFLAKRGISYTVLFDKNRLNSTYRIEAFPTIYLVDRNGKIAAVQIGYGEAIEAELEEQIKALLK